MRKIKRKLHIDPADLVLEIGSGDEPYAETDVLVDKYLDDNKEREAGLPLAIDKRPLVLADGCFLPFRDKAFDYVIASHILEHVDNPEMFIKEVVRVAKRGYIETPAPLRERVFDWPFHKWYVSFENNCLCLTAKTKKSRLGRFKTVTAEEFELLTFLEGRRLTNCSFEWKGAINYRIATKESEEFLLCIDGQLKKELARLGAGKLVLYLLWSVRKLYLKSYILPYFREKLRGSKFLAKPAPSGRAKIADISGFLVCPKCKGDLQSQRSGFSCRKCNKRYRRVTKGIINFVI